MKRVLIISPYFPPLNTADMQRVRMSLPYFKDFGWDAEVVTVDAAYTDMGLDELLVESVPPDIKIHRVKALDKKWTSKFGLGGVAYRSLWFFKQKVNALLKANKFDLIYFSTTQFPVCILGAYWKKRFNVPYIIDMQDPWHSDYYKDKPKEQQPPKYWLSYRFNKYMEPIAMKKVDGLISVSESYIETLKARYPEIKNIPAETITFGAFEPDTELATRNQNRFDNLLNPGFKNIVYIGRGGMDMHTAITPVFEVLKKGLSDEPGFFNRLKFYFIGTSYAPAGKGTPTILPLATQFGIQDSVVEITSRIGYYHTLNTLSNADGLFVPGSDDPKYTASKIYPYLLTYKPLLAIFNSQSSAIKILKEFGADKAYSYDVTPDIGLKIELFLKQVITNHNNKPYYYPLAIEKYSARTMTKYQCDLFNKVIQSP